MSKPVKLLPKSKELRAIQWTAANLVEVEHFLSGYPVSNLHNCLRSTAFTGICYMNDWIILGDDGQFSIKDDEDIRRDFIIMEMGD